MPTGVYQRTEYHIKRLSESKKGKKPKNIDLFLRLGYKPPKKTHKKCPACGLVKLRNDFVGSKHKKMHSYCKPCFAKKSLEWRTNNPEKAKEAKRKASLKKNFGITIEEYEEILNKQGGVCAVCGKSPEERLRNGKSIRLAVDHCHKTGVIRGILCADCNRGIGQLGDSIDGIQKALNYLNISTTEIKRRICESV